MRERRDYAQLPCRNLSKAPSLYLEPRCRSTFRAASRFLKNVESFMQNGFFMWSNYTKFCIFLRYKKGCFGVGMSPRKLNEINGLRVYGEYINYLKNNFLGRGSFFKGGYLRSYQIIGTYTAHSAHSMLQIVSHNGLYAQIGNNFAHLTLLCAI